MIKRRRIFITGQVQGVGFRPSVYRIARGLGLSGVVYNDTKGVTIELQGKLNKGIKVFPISAKTGEGMTDWYDWLVKSVEKNSVQY